MFDLENEIAGWRKQMLAAGVKSPVPLEELEGHLREDIEAQVQSGLDEQKAFEISARRMGEAKALKLEFDKTIATHKDMSAFNLILNTIFLTCLSLNACWVAPVVIRLMGSSFWLREGWLQSADLSLAMGAVFLGYLLWARRNNPNFTLIFLNLPSQDAWGARHMKSAVLRLEQATSFQRVLRIGSVSPGIISILCFFAFTGLYGFIRSLGILAEVCMLSS